MVDERLRERDVGEWSGLTDDEIHKGWPGWLDDGRRPDGFEDVDVGAGPRDRGVRGDPRSEPRRIAAGGHPRRRDPLAGQGRTGSSDAPVPNLAGVTVRVTDSGQVVGERLALLDGQTVTVTQNDEL